MGWKRRMVDMYYVHISYALWALNFPGRQLSIESTVYWRLLVNVSHTTTCVSFLSFLSPSHFIFFFLSFYFTKSSIIFACEIEWFSYKYGKMTEISLLGLTILAGWCGFPAACWMIELLSTWYVNAYTQVRIFEHVN